MRCKQNSYIKNMTKNLLMLFEKDGLPQVDQLIETYYRLDDSTRSELFDMTNYLVKKRTNKGRLGKLKKKNDYKPTSRGHQSSLALIPRPCYTLLRRGGDSRLFLVQNFIEIFDEVGRDLCYTICRLLCHSGGVKNPGRRADIEIMKETRI